MQRSPKKHPLAVLRLFLNLSQEKMGKLIGVSKPTVQAIELKQLKLTAPVAERVVKQTNVNFDWLLNGDPRARMLNAEGWPYQQHNFENAQGTAGWEKDPTWEKELPQFAELFADHYRDRLHEILTNALRKGRHQWVWWKTETLLKELEQEFGILNTPIKFILPPATEEEIELASPPKPISKKTVKMKSADGSATLPTAKEKKKPRGKLRRT